MQLVVLLDIHHSQQYTSYLASLQHSHLVHKLWWGWFHCEHVQCSFGISLLVPEYHPSGTLAPAPLLEHTFQSRPHLVGEIGILHYKHIDHLHCDIRVSTSTLSCSQRMVLYELFWSQNQCRGTFLSLLCNCQCRKVHISCHSQCLKYGGIPAQMGSDRLNVGSDKTHVGQ